VDKPKRRSVRRDPRRVPRREHPPDAAEDDVADDLDFRVQASKRALSIAVPPLLPTVDALTAWGRALGAVLEHPGIVTLSGDLGTGKTTLVRALCEGLGVLDTLSVTSPTYALMQEYPLHGGYVVHADLYRLRSGTELLALGWDDIVATAPVLLIEWPDSARDTLPSGVIQIALHHHDADQGRRVLSVSVSESAPSVRA
jgi:tRNA threonylcarbamoyladenosine biosynthesis protein TsaE